MEREMESLAAEAKRWIARLGLGRPFAKLSYNSVGDPHGEYEQ